MIEEGKLLDLLLPWWVDHGRQISSQSHGHYSVNDINYLRQVGIRVGRKTHKLIAWLRLLGKYCCGNWQVWTAVIEFLTSDWTTVASSTNMKSYSTWWCRLWWQLGWQVCTPLNLHLLLSSSNVKCQNGGKQGNQQYTLENDILHILKAILRATVCTNV